MKDNNPKLFSRHYVITAIGIIVFCLFEPAYCQIDDTALLLQQTPADGGRITPGAGVHHFAGNSEVTLTAIPRSGYQFVYWLGDVSEPTANSTVAYLDTPKIIIAVFERIEHDFLVMEAVIRSVPTGGAAARSAPDYSRQGYTGGGRPRPRKWRWPPRKPDDDDELQDFPVPDEGDDIPVPEVPEPATVLLLTLGICVLSRKRKNKRAIICKKN